MLTKISVLQKYGHIEHIEKPIRLNFNDGRLDDVICVESGETQNSLNVKRAIASIFQTSLKNQYETDVFGLCPTEVSEKKEGGALVIQRNRNLNKCAYRESIKQVSPPTFINSAILAFNILCWWCCYPAAPLHAPPLAGTSVAAGVEVQHSSRTTMKLFTRAWK